MSETFAAQHVVMETRADDARLLRSAELLAPHGHHLAQMLWRW